VTLNIFCLALAALGFPILRMDTFLRRGCRGRERSDQRRRV